MFWEAQQALVLADTHFGKAATFRNRGIPVPTGTTDVMLNRISANLAQTGATKIYFLGDFVHSYARYQTDFISELVQWRKTYWHIEMTLIMGNHDRGQTALFEQLNLSVVQEPLLIGGLALCHFPETRVPAGTYCLAGHLHPAVKVVGAGDLLAKIPCFYFGPRVGVLPAFGEFTGTMKIKPSATDRVFAIADDQVIEVRTKSPAMRTKSTATNPRLN